MERRRGIGIGTGKRDNDAARSKRVKEIKVEGSLSWML